MAKAEVQLPEEMLTRLSQLGTKSDEIAEKMLRQAVKFCYHASKATSQV